MFRGEGIGPQRLAELTPDSVHEFAGFTSSARSMDIAETFSKRDAMYVIDCLNGRAVDELSQSHVSKRFFSTGKTSFRVETIDDRPVIYMLEVDNAQRAAGVSIWGWAPAQ